MISALATLAFAAAPPVTTTADSGAGSLRAALAAAGPGDTIVFDPGAFPANTLTPIALASTLSVVDAGLLLDGGGRVSLACAASMTLGSALSVTADQVLVAGLEVRDCPDHGVLVTAAQVVLSGNTVRANDKFGILVNGAPTVTWGVSVSGNDVFGNCAATTATCAGIGVRRGGGTGPGPLDITVSDNDVDGQGSGGHGIAVLGGDDVAVADNRVGLGGGNAGHGVVCSAQTGLTAQGSVQRNTVVNNLGAGIQLGARRLPSTVEANRVGTDGAAALGNGLAGIEVFGSDGHVLRDNVVADNTGAGIVVNGLVGGSPAEDVVIEQNLVGLAADGETPLGNGADGVVLSGAAAPARHFLIRNTIAANAGDGVEVNVQDVTLSGNAIGTTPRLVDGLGNGGHGVRVGADGDRARLDSWSNQNVLVPTLVYGNTGDGVNVLGDDVVVLGARVGRNGDDGVSANRPGFELRESHVVENVARGVHLGSASTDAVIAANELVGNGTTGLTVDANADRIEWSLNHVRDNGTCGMSIHSSVNDAPGLARPVVVDVTPTRIGGTFPTPAGATVERIEVFADGDTEPNEP